MKKQLLCTSAIALGCAMAAPVAAQDWDVKIGGYMSQHLAYSSVSGNVAAPGTDYDGFDTFNTSEIHFLPSVTLDNGITFGVNIQFEGTTNGGATQDESFMEISSDTLGKFIIGNENSAGYKSMVGAPTVTHMWINSPSISGFIPTTAAGTTIRFRDSKHSTWAEVAGNNDVPRLTYFTPSFNGLTIGVSYASSNQNNAGNNFGNDRNAGGTVSDIFDIGVNYSQTIGSVDVNLSARWGTGDLNAAAAVLATAPNAGPDGIDGTADDVAIGDVVSAATPGGSPEVWGVGASLGFGAFTIGGSYGENDNAGPGGGAGAAGRPDSQGWSLGATYDAPGPWSFELVTYQGESNNLLIPFFKDDYKAYRIGANRNLGPGVSLDVYAIYTESDLVTTPGTDIKATIIGTAINLSF